MSLYTFITDIIFFIIGLKELFKVKSIIYYFYQKYS